MIGDNWGATDVERAATLPCDALAGAVVAADRAISIAARTGLVFAWLCQMRVAPYSYDLLDNWGRRSSRERDMALTELQRGQRFMTLFELVDFEPDRSLTLRTASVAVTYAVAPEGLGSRVHVRVLFGGRPLLGRLLAVGDLVMMRKQLLTFKALAERDEARQQVGR